MFEELKLKTEVWTDKGSTNTVALYYYKNHTNLVYQALA